MTAPSSEHLELLTPTRVAEVLHLSIHTIRQQMRDGRLPAVKVNGRWRVHRAAFEALLAPVGGGGR